MTTATQSLFGMPVVNMKAVPCPAARASKLVAHQHVFPLAGEVIPRMPVGAITLRAEPGDGGDAFATGAEQRLLPETRPGCSPQEAFSIIGEG
ncbi:MAG TPA: hypothetical protein VG345_06320 [Bryobacteraceae bacterium]|nr:hypothetical protein [Bryobacteraceae bacterium]